MTRRARATPAIETPVLDREEEEAFFRTLQERMPEKSRNAIEALRRVKSVYVPCGRDKALRVGFDRFLERFMAGRNTVRDEADIYFLVGESGAGKSAAIGRLLREHPSLQTQETSYGPVTPYVSIKLKGYTLPRLVAGQIVRAAGYGRVDAGKQGELWDGLGEALRGQFVFLVHIDEAQHLMKKTATKRERQELANALKGASIDMNWPVAFILSGLPEVMKVAGEDEQVERRGDFTVFTDVSMPDERDLVVDVIKQMAEPVGVDVADVIQGDLPERLAHAARYRYGRICQLVLSALHEAIHKGRNELTVANFARAYERRSTTLGRDDRNPFLALDWSNLDSGSFLDLAGDDEGEGA